MNKYHKIQNLFKRDEKTHKLIFGEWRTDWLEYLRANKWEFTEKIDGTNIRIHWNGKDVTFGGRTDKAEIPKHLLAKLKELFPPEKLKAEFNPDFDETDVMLYGEGYGQKIQKAGNLYLPNDVSFILFDVWIGRWCMQREDVDAIAARLGIKSVPIIASKTLYGGILLVRQGFNSKISEIEQLAEGVIGRPKIELLTRSGERVIVKIKRRDFVQEEK